MVLRMLLHNFSRKFFPTCRLWVRWTFASPYSILTPMWLNPILMPFADYSSVEKRRKASNIFTWSWWRRDAHSPQHPLFTASSRFLMTLWNLAWLQPPKFVWDAGANETSDVGTNEPSGKDLCIRHVDGYCWKARWDLENLDLRHWIYLMGFLDFFWPDIIRFGLWFFVALWCNDHFWVYLRPCQLCAVSRRELCHLLMIRWDCVRAATKRVYFAEAGAWSATLQRLMAAACRLRRVYWLRTALRELVTENARFSSALTVIFCRNPVATGACPTDQRRWRNTNQRTHTHGVPKSPDASTQTSLDYRLVLASKNNDRTTDKCSSLSRNPSQHIRSPRFIPF